jgi:hypothetical protein
MFLWSVTARSSVVARRPPGRCPVCRKLSLTRSSAEADSPGESDRFQLARCARCGGRFRRRFGTAWEEVTPPSEFVDPIVLMPRAAIGPPPAPRSGSRWRFNLRDVMVVVVVLAPNLAVLGKVARESSPVGLTATAIALVALNALFVFYVKNFGALRKHPFQTWRIVVVGAAGTCLIAVAGILLIFAMT